MWLLHTSTDGFVAFAVGDEDGLFPKIAIRSDSLAEHVPQLLRDSYISINQAFRVKRFNNKHRNSGIPCHRTDTLRYLCAAYADLDFYRIGLVADDVIARLAELKNEGVIPGPSLLVSSGRGMWVLWLLRDENDPEHPARIWKQGLQLKQHKEVQAALHNRLAHVGADNNASNAVRYIRIPGSLNTKSETVVSWEIQVDENCQLPRYTLAQLKERLGIADATTLQAKETVTPTPADLSVKPKRGRAGWDALRTRRFKDFLSLWKIRGSFRKGCRNNAVFYYSLLLAQHGIPIQNARASADRLNGSSSSPLKQSIVYSAVTSAYSHKYKKLYDQTIADWLDITPEEASKLQCKAMARRFHVGGDIAEPKPKRIDKDNDRITARQSAILQIITEAKGVVPSSREMAYVLNLQGFAVSHMTVATDYRSLGLKAKQLKDDHMSK
jgi:Primase C terminal 1 (PriCT-1)